jgi:hypothetical protein
VSTPPPPPPGGGVSGPLAPTRPGSPRPGDPSFVGPVASKPVDFQSLLTSAPPPGAPLTLGRSPGSLDLSLPTNPELQTAATPDPWRARDRFAAGNPTEISTLGEAFAKAGGDFEEAHALSTQTQKLLAAGYTNDATPVYDQATHIASLPKNFPDAPTRLSSIGKQLGTTATELSTRTTTAAAAVNTLLDTLDQKRAAWQNEWQAARNPDGLIPFDQIDALLARRTTVAAQMQTTVNTTGATIGASVTAYEGILADGMKVLSTIGYVPPDNLDAGPGDTNYDTATARDRAADLTSAVQDGANPATMGRVTDALAPIATLNAVEAAGGTLTPEQQAFRRDFYQGAGGDTLSGLAGLVNKAAPGPSADAALATAGNGIMNLSRYHDGAYIPEAVNGMVSQRLGVAAHDPSFPSGGTRRLDDGSVQVAGVARYEGTAALLAASTTPGGANFVHQVGESALQAKQDLNTTGRPPGWLAVVPTTGIPAVDDVFAAGAHKFSADVTRAGESPINTMLGVVARDPAASQALLGAPKDGFIYPHDPGRQTLLGAGWTDGSGAAAVLRSATAPAQSTPQLATNSAALTGTIISEIGEDPAGWRKLIPKGSAVSDQLTALAADRIDSFAYPQGSSHLLQPTVHNADGSYTTPLRLGLDLGRPDERVPFLNFVARGGDVHHAGADPDMIRIRAAADDFTINSLSDAIRHGPPDGSGPRGFDNALSQAGNLDGVITRSQYDALLQQSGDEDRSAAETAANRTIALTAVERIIAIRATGGVAQIKDPFNVAFDGVMRQGPLAAPTPETPLLSGQLLDSSNAEYLNHRSYLIVAAMHDAGDLPPVAEPFVVDGHLLPLDQIRQLPGNSLAAMQYLATEGPDHLHAYWPGSVTSADTARAGYSGAGITVEAEPTWPISRATTSRIRYGDGD